MAGRMITLTVGTRDETEWKHSFDLISQVGAELAMTHHYASVTTFDPNEIDDNESDELDHDENTLMKVRDALVRELVASGAVPPPLIERIVTDCISGMQKAGVYFRERLS